MDYFYTILHSNLCDVGYCGGIDGGGFLHICFRPVHRRISSAVDEILNSVIGYKGINLVDIGDIQCVGIGKKEAVRQVHAGSQCFDLTAQLPIGAGNQHILLYQPVKVLLFGCLLLGASQSFA